MRQQRSALVGFSVAMAAVVVASLNLRAGLASIAPVIDYLAEDLGVSTSTAGVLTSLPGFFFAALGWGAVPLASRWGITPTMLFGSVILAVGLGARPFVDGFPAFLVLTAGVVGGIALGNVLIPAWIKAHATQHQSVPLMTAYTTVMGLSGAIAPLSALVFSGAHAWRWALGVWLVPALAQVGVWVWIMFLTGKDTPAAESTKGPKPAADEFSEAERRERALRRRAARTPLWKSHTAVAMLAFFGVQSSMGYTEMGWLPHMLTDKGVGEEIADIALVLWGVVNLIGGIVMPWMVAHYRSLTITPVVLAVLTFAGWVGVYVNAQAAPLVWSLLLAAGGLCFPLALALLTARTRTPEVTARLSGFVQPGGYLFAGLVPLIVGWIYGVTGGWDTSLFMLIIWSAGLLIFGVRAVRNVHIEDELVGDTNRPRELADAELHEKINPRGTGHQA